MLEGGDVDPNGVFLIERLEFPKSGVERAEQGRASKHIGLGWSEQSKYS